MHILMVSRGYPSEKYHGSGIFEFDQAKALAKAGCKVIFACVDLRSLRRWRKWGYERLTKDGVEIYAVNIPLGRVPKAMLAFFGRWGIKQLYKRIVKEHGEPDVVHSHFTEISNYALALKPMTNAKFVMTEHNSAVNKPVENIEPYLLNVASETYSNYDKVIAVSSTLAKNVKSISGVNAKIIPNILDTDIFCDVRKSKHSVFSFVFVGNLIPLKNPALCISAFAKAFPDGKEYLTVIGDGTERAACENLVRELRLDDRVIFTGKIKRTDIAKILSDSDCFVLPSQSETFGVAYIEAMASGLPVIATRCGGPESFVDETNGVLIPVNNEQALIDAFKYMRENIGKYDSTKIAEETVKKFSPEAVAKQLMELYEELQKK